MHKNTNKITFPEIAAIKKSENRRNRFIIESDIDDFWSNQQIHWIDGEPGDEELIAELVEAAEEFLEKEFENEEMLDEEDEE